MDPSEAETASFGAPFLYGGVGYIPVRGTGRRGHVAEGEATVRAWAKVDASDFEWASSHRWHLTDSGYAARWYGGRPPKRKCERMARRVIGLEPGDRRQVDHINRDKLDNRRANLRLSSDQTNHQNVPARGGTSPHRGVSFDASRGKWLAQAKCNGKRLIKRFATEAEAAEAASAWRRDNMPFATD